MVSAWSGTELNVVNSFKKFYFFIFLSGAGYSISIQLYTHEKACVTLKFLLKTFFGLYTCSYLSYNTLFRLHIIIQSVYN